MKVVFAVIVLCILSALSVILIFPEIHIESRVSVGRTTAYTWGSLIRATHMHVWPAGLKQAECASENHAEAGSHHRLILEQEGELIVVEEVVTAVEPQQRYAFRRVSHSADSRSEMRLAPGVDGVEITLDTVVEPKGVMKAIMPFMVRSIKRRQDADLNYLKHLIES